jgi:hypothetical protein
MRGSREKAEYRPRRPEEDLVPRLLGPLPSHDEASLDLVEATLWRLLAGRSTRRSGTDVAWLVGLVQRYAEAYAGRLARDGVSSAARLVAPRPSSPVCEADAEDVAAASVVEQSPTRAEVAAAASRLNGSTRAPEDAVEAVIEEADGPVEGLSKRCRDCAAVKPLEEFYASRTNRDGRKGSCKACVSEQRRQVRTALNRQRVLASQRPPAP